MGILSKLLKKLISKDDDTASSYTKPTVPSNRTTNTVSKSTSTVHFNVAIETNQQILSFQGDYAKTVFLMQYAKGAVPASKTYPQYLLYECGIRDAKAYRDQLIRENMLSEPDALALLSGMKLADIKNVCATFGITQTGKKDAVISKLISEVGESELIKVLPSEKSYMLTERGKEFLAKHEGYQVIHRNRKADISWKEYDQQHRDDETPYETLIRIVHNRMKNMDYTKTRNEYQILSELYEKSGDKSKSAEMLLYVQYYDLSGIYSYDSVQIYRNNRVFAGEDTLNSIAKIYAETAFAPAIVAGIADKKEYITSEMIDQVNTLQLPFNICSPLKFKQYINAILEGTLVPKDEIDTLQTTFKDGVLI